VIGAVGGCIAGIELAKHQKAAKKAAAEKAQHDAVITPTSPAPMAPAAH
jgi:hypothetical protein